MKKYIIVIVTVIVLIGISSYAKTPKLSNQIVKINEQNEKSLSKEDIARLANLFDDRSQVHPRIAKWINKDNFIFLQFDTSDMEKATELRYIGIGTKGVFCAEVQPDPAGKSFIHFHKYGGEYGRNNNAGDQGYWLTWVAVKEFHNRAGIKTQPGIDYAYVSTPPPFCGENTPEVDFPVSGPEQLTQEDLTELAAFFNDKVFTDGEVTPIGSKWVNEDVFISLLLDSPQREEASGVRYIGIGQKGVFCKSKRPHTDFTHFHNGYWLLWVAADTFRNQDGKTIAPGVDRTFSRAAPPDCE